MPRRGGVSNKRQRLPSGSYREDVVPHEGSQDESYQESSAGESADDELISDIRRPTKPAPKRKADTAAGGDSKRAASTADIPSDWREMVQDGRIHKETVGSLKNICTHLGLKVSGTKPVLISRLTEKAHE